ncbi:hypothetical protein BX616_000780 [Lobosporangium transversale]|uniref:ADP-ribosylglycohydrolase-domain-containing protein n=1 Tax=Lobosporangium transversale TaxID=64571 RepID=A0A1Y2H2I3_9FUNG|nr:ADP-ribosylglycohydrolase-domain-containing protein [Lobosporangium transversale]KAF9906210.1 hypothetical protein BX616_000780 [Lobosporangium transversale]ORZ28780.1 ADP-ribosylglycohydrolase-domain-containing protein [Lobosporangium transversale]|eukprot:XP_021886453.1 ADP-ribosylglycohydrolase-domain-containing protein [Lobosporangium transversale]
MVTLTREQIKDRILGCLFGNAVGDAYGLATEFMSKETARKRYGNGPIAFGLDPGYPIWIDYHRSKWERNDFTDDTDQMLLILQSLQQTQDGRLHAANFSKRLKEWSIIGFPELGTPPRGIGYTVGSTLSHSDFRYNPHKAAFDIWDSKGRTLAANGAVMRTSVLGIESFWDEARVVENALAAAKVTHADPRSVVSALIASVLISRLLRGGGVDIDQDSAHVWNARLQQAQYKQELLDYLRRGSYIQGEQSSNPAYEPETEQNLFKNKDKNAIAESRLQSAMAAWTSSPDTATRSFGLGIVEKVANFVKGTPAAASPDNWNTGRPTVQLRKNIGWGGIDQVGGSQPMTALARSVVNDYIFLLRETDLIPSTIRIENSAQGNNALDGSEQIQQAHDKTLASIQDKWAYELESHCFPNNLAQLDLGEGSTMGYTFKCVGVGFYAVTRHEDPQPIDSAYNGPAGLFRGIMEQVTLEAGDADTNGAVVGSLLGARFGIEKGIPSSWWTELRHFEWLNHEVNDFAERVLLMYEDHEQRLQRQQQQDTQQ